MKYEAITYDLGEIDGTRWIIEATVYGDIQPPDNRANWLVRIMSWNSERIISVEPESIKKRHYCSTSATVQLGGRGYGSVLACCGVELLRGFSYGAEKLPKRIVHEFLFFLYKNQNDLVGRNVNTFMFILNHGQRSQWGGQLANYAHQQGDSWTNTYHGGGMLYLYRLNLKEYVGKLYTTLQEKFNHNTERYEYQSARIIENEQPDEQVSVKPSENDTASRLRRKLQESAADVTVGQIAVAPVPQSLSAVPSADGLQQSMSATRHRKR